MIFWRSAPVIKDALAVSPNPFPSRDGSMLHAVRDVGGEIARKTQSGAEGEEERGDDMPVELTPFGLLMASLRCPNDILLVFPNTYSFFTST